MRPFNTRQTLLAVLAIALLAGPAIAQPPAQRDWKERFRAHDRNRDSRIDRAEFQEWMVDAFFYHDQGKKGYLTMEDVKGVMRPEVFAAANRKGDGKLWLGEFLNALFQDFDAIDAVRSGSITIQEIEAYIHRRSN